MKILSNPETLLIIMLTIILTIVLLLATRRLIVHRYLSKTKVIEDTFDHLMTFDEATATGVVDVTTKFTLMIGAVSLRLYTEAPVMVMNLMTYAMLEEHVRMVHQITMEVFREEQENEQKTIDSGDI